MTTANEILEILSPKQVLDAQQAGRNAYNAGERFDTCPHVVDGDAVPEHHDRIRALQLMWIRGYADERNNRRYAGNGEDRQLDSP